MQAKTVTIRLLRENTFQEYRIPFEIGMNALAAIKYIYEFLDRSVAYPTCLCRMGRCGACAMRINGKAVLGCAFKMEAGETYEIAAIDSSRTIRDLVCG